MKRKDYQRPSIRVIETEVQQPIAASNIRNLSVSPWSEDENTGTINDD